MCKAHQMYISSTLIDMRPRPLHRHHGQGVPNPVVGVNWNVPVPLVDDTTLISYMPPSGRTMLQGAARPKLFVEALEHDVVNPWFAMVVFPLTHMSIRVQSPSQYVLPPRMIGYPPKVPIVRGRTKPPSSEPVAALGSLTPIVADVYWVVERHKRSTV